MKARIVIGLAIALLTTSAAGANAQVRTRQILTVRDERTSVTVSQYIEQGATYVEVEGFQDPWIGFHRWTPSEARKWLGVADSLAALHDIPARGETITYDAFSLDGPSISRDVTTHGSLWILGFEDRDGVVFTAALSDGQMRRLKAAIHHIVDALRQ